MIVDPKTNQPRKKLVVRAPNAKLLTEWKRSINYVITQARDRMLEARKGGKPAALPMSRSAGAMAGAGDPRVTKYVQMLKVGLPREAVMQKASGRCWRALAGGSRVIVEPRADGR